MNRHLALISLLWLIITVLAGCQRETDVAERPLFRKVYEQKQDHSDKKAIRLAVQMTDSMGGYDTWQEKRYLGWVFFGMRSWLWDKETNDVRMHSRRDSLTVLMNLDSRDGKVFKDGERVTNPDTIDKYLKIGYRSWANDSYWLFMPFKVFDPGVRLTYKGKEATPRGKEAHVVRLTYDSVGVTPENQYDVYIDPESKLVKAWQYYPEPGAKPITTPWTGYRNYNGLKLANNRGSNYKLSEISVRDSLNRAVFDTYNPYDSLNSPTKDQPVP